MLDRNKMWAIYIIKDFLVVTFLKMIHFEIKNFI